MGYDQSAYTSGQEQPDSVKFYLFAMFTIIPALTGSFGIIPMLFYDLHGKRVGLPYFGKRSLFIFYIDPDTGLSGNKNLQHAEIIEQSGVLSSPNIYSFGVLNLKDTFLPNNLIRSMARRRTERNHGYLLVDTDCSLPNAWQIGDCNGKFCFLIVNRQGELIFAQKDEMTNQDLIDLLNFVSNILCQVLKSFFSLFTERAYV